MILIPNCSEFVSRIKLNNSEIKYFKKRVEDEKFNDGLIKTYFDDYLKAIPNELVFIGTGEETVLRGILSEIKLIREIKNGEVDLDDFDT